MERKMQALQIIRPSLRDTLVTLFRFKWTFVISFSTILAMGILATVMTERVYEAKTRVYIGTDVKQVKLNQSDQTLRVGLEELVATEVELIKSIPIVEKAIQDTGPDPSGSFPSIDEVLDGLRILPVRITSLIELRLQYRDRAYAIRLLDSIVAAYLAKRRMQGMDTEEARHYQELLDDISARISETESRLRAFGESHSITDITTQSQRDLDRISSLSISRVDLERALLGMRREAEMLDSLRTDFAPENIPSVLLNRDPQLLAWVQEHARLTQHRIQLSAELAPGAGPLGRADWQLSALADHIRSQIDRNARMARQDVSVKQAELDLLNREIGSLQSSNRALAGSAGEFTSLEQQLEDLRSVRTVLTRQLEETRIRMVDPGSLRVEQVEKSQSFPSPIKPNTLFNMTASLVLALLLAISLPFYKQAVGGTLFHDSEVQKTTGLPVLCSVRDQS